MTNTYVTGAALGLNAKTLPGLVFDIDACYTGCLICGEVYQSRLDRKVRRIKDGEMPNLLNKYESYVYLAKELRQRWTVEHAKTHTDQEHAQLKASGAFCTPEAALKLTPLGIFPLDDASDATIAMLEAPRAPLDDVQGT